MLKTPALGLIWAKNICSLVVCYCGMLLWDAMHLDSLTTGKSAQRPSLILLGCEMSWGPRRVGIFPWGLHKLQSLVVSCMSR